ncbi:MAG: mannose-1-phosphate guanylyltransferase/mannose-6-phosphate isomerase [Pseudomonadota bacterium]
MKLVPIIISGGTGSRLWPLSREQHPKPFIELPDRTTLIGRTYRRCASLRNVDNIITVLNERHYFLARDIYSKEDIESVDDFFVLEPAGRNTAPAIAAGLLNIKQRFGSECLALILPADHMITDQNGFEFAIEQARVLAADGIVVTFGIEPEYPETGYGYIECEGDKVIRFTEKPDIETARAYLESGKHLWNSGMFCFRVDVMLEALNRHVPDILASVSQAIENGKVANKGGEALVELDEGSFSQSPSISIDYAIMEKLSDMSCVKAAFGWSDIGSWQSLGNLFDPDNDGNRTFGDTILMDSSNCVVKSGKRVVSLLGVENLVVVDTDDALLVASKANSQKVGAVFDELKSQEREAAILPRTVHRPWGTYTVLEEGDCFKIKQIVVKPGERLSLQAHKHRSEHWVVVSGTAKVVNGEEEITLETNQSTYIPCGHKHRLENPTTLPLILIEVQSGDYVGEDDIIRFEDIYGRS